MTLTFKTADLLAVIDKIIASRDAAAAKYKADCEAAIAQYRKEWLADNTEKVRKLRDYLSESLKKAVPPLHSEARRIMEQTDGYRSSGVSFFTPGGDGNVKQESLGYYHDYELVSLAELLRAHQLETVTAHQLKELGTHPRDLAKLFQAAVKAGAAVVK